MTGRQIRHPGHLRMAVYKAMPAKPAPDYRDVLNLSDEDPSRTPLTMIAHQLRVSIEVARELRNNAIRYLRDAERARTPFRVPTMQEKALIQNYQFSASEAKEAMRMIQNGEIKCPN